MHEVPRGLQDMADEFGVPVIPPLSLPGAIENEVVAVCGQCGIYVRRVMGQCPNLLCPVHRQMPSEVHQHNRCVWFEDRSLSPSDGEQVHEIETSEWRAFWRNVRECLRLG